MQTGPGGPVVADWPAEKAGTHQDLAPGVVEVNRQWMRSLPEPGPPGRRCQFSWLVALESVAIFLLVSVKGGRR
jgi:hypothetical protein